MTGHGASAWLHLPELFQKVSILKCPHTTSLHVSTSLLSCIQSWQVAKSVLCYKEIIIFKDYNFSGVSGIIQIRRWSKPLWQCALSYPRQEGGKRGVFIHNFKKNITTKVTSFIFQPLGRLLVLLWESVSQRRELSILMLLMVILTK